jgi:hypothetical protein
MNASFILRLIATICVILFLFGVAPQGFHMGWVGIALWVGSTLLPGPGPK